LPKLPKSNFAIQGARAFFVSCLPLTSKFKFLAPLSASLACRRCIWGVGTSCLGFVRERPYLQWFPRLLSLVNRYWNGRLSNVLGLFQFLLQVRACTV